MKGKYLSTLLVSAAVLGSVIGLSGCSKKNNTSDSGSKSVDFVIPEGGFDTSKDVTIKFYTTMGDTLQKVFYSFLEDDFAKAYPNIHVDTQFIGGYDDVRSQMNTELAAGESNVNVAYCYPDHIATYNKAKSVVCLDNLINDETYGFTKEEYDDFVTAFYDEGKTFGDGKMYCLPFSKSTEVLYYNSQFFAENNLSVPDHWFTNSSSDTTSMEYVCAKIKEIDPKSTPLGYDSGSNLFITMCEQMNIPYTTATGNNHYLFNNQDAKDMVSTFKDWYTKGYLTTKDLNGSYTSGLFTSTEERKCYMCVGSSAGASYQSIKVGEGDNQKEVTRIAALPQEDAENHGAAVQQGPDVCIFQNNDSQKVLASWIFIKYFTTSTLFQAEFSMESGYMPVIQSAYQNEVYKEWLDESEEDANGNINIQALSTKVSVNQEKYYFTSASFEGSTTARTQVGNIITAVLSGTETLDAAFDNAIAKCNA